MSPFTLVDQTDDQNRLELFMSSPPLYQAVASCSFPFPTSFDSLLAQDQAAGSSCTSNFGHDDIPSQKADTPIWLGTRNDYDQACSSSSLVQPVVMSNKDHQYLSIATHPQGEGKSNNIGSRPRAVKWMSSKMRLIQKMTTPDLTTSDDSKYQSLHHQETSETSFSSNTNKATARVCSDCNTSSTPLWRGGPRGPKSLCNACGIRQRKARRAMEEAAAATASGFVVGATDTTSSPKGKVIANKEKKSRCKKNKGKLIVADSSSIFDQTNKRNNNQIRIKALSFERVFPQDVAQAAILLMELSCGLINHSS